LLDLTQEVGKVGTWEWSIEDHRLTWSDELHRIFGVPRTSRPTFDMFVSKIHPDDRADVERIIQETLSACEPFSFDHRILTPDGEVRWLLCRGRVILGSDGKPREMVGSSQDITERREMEAQLLLSAKLASLGTLASGVAHEINNPLGYVANNLAILERQLGALSGKGNVSADELRRLRAAVEAAQHGSARVRDIVGGLKAFARAGDDERSGVDLARAADLAIEIASHEITHRARLVRDYAPAPPVLANESRLSQVLVNLLVNAAHAMEPRGAADNEIRVRIYEDERGRACVDVSDTGSGVSPGHVERIFDPFFTTKPTGMGLGLSVSHKLLRDFGGELELARTGAEGSTFRVSLPAAPASAIPPPPAHSMPVKKTPMSRKRLLVIDDEARYAESLRLLLGYEHEVGVATDAEQALALLSSGGAPFDAILCDLMMPGKTGIDLYDDLTKCAPELCQRMVFLTGGATSDRAREFLARPGIRYLEKPVELPALEAAIETVTTRQVSAA
jgi:PAS domain S-box-containing protein